jgi:predicted MFS family arabinose efflux permease
VTEVFWVNAVSFLFVIWALAVIRPKQQPRPDTGEPPLQMLMAGIRYAASHRRIRMHLLTATMLTIFGMPFSTLLPAIAKSTLGLGASGYSGLMAANGLGALIGALSVASLPHTVRREVIVRGGLTTMAIGALVLSFSRWIPVTVITLAVMGVAFLATVSSINTNLQTAVPPHLRGRVMSLFVLAFMGMMPFGALAAGALGDAIGTSWTIFGGALVLLAWGVFLFVRPDMLCSGEGPDCM